MIELRRTLSLRDGLAIVIGIMISAGIFRTPGLIAAQLGRPWLTFVAWILGGVVALAGALIFAELGVRMPRAGGKYEYTGAAFGARAGFVFAPLLTSLPLLLIPAPWPFEVLPVTWQRSMRRSPALAGCSIITTGRMATCIWRLRNASGGMGWVRIWCRS